MELAFVVFFIEDRMVAAIEAWWRWGRRGDRIDDCFLFRVSGYGAK